MDRHSGCHSRSEIMLKTVLNTMQSVNQLLLCGKGFNPELRFYFMNFLANNKILDWLKFKAFADDKFKFVLGKGENAGYSILSFPTMFSKGFFFEVVRRLCGKGLTLH